MPELPPFTICDFATPGPAEQSWEVINDPVMGGRSWSRWELQDGAAVFRGEVSLENGGGFASVRSFRIPVIPDTTRALRLRVRGDGRRYRCTARMESSSDAPLYQSHFETSAGAWQQITLSLASFAPSFRGTPLYGVPGLTPEQIVSLGFLISDRQAGPFRLEIQWIRAGVQVQA
jgi:monofunctional biosynthetic peptidoglycan transglycosylase